MKKISLNHDWQFTLGDREWFYEKHSERVDLPHDFVVSLPLRAENPGRSGNGYFGDGRGEYTKTLLFGEEINHQAVYLLIDGAFMNAEVYLDSDQLACHPYGYTPFQIDLTGRLVPGKEHTLRIITQSRQPSTRWYSGGGVFRETALLVGPQPAILPWNVFAYTEKADPRSASVRVNIDFLSPVSGKVKAMLLDSDGKAVLETKQPALQQTELTFKVEKPHLWSVDDPYLYTLELALSSGDVHQQQLGIRQIEIDATEGFRLNGKPMKLKGGCIHHDNGPLGAASFPAAEERRMRLMKSAGYNAIRSSHNPPSQALLDACDKLGMLMMTEAFDAWADGKVALDYHLYFRDWWERDVEAMVLSGRNHPCVFSYSIGNEIPERDGHGEGASWAVKLAAKVKSLDSTRPVTSALNGFSAPEDAAPFLPTIGSSPSSRKTRTLQEKDYFGEKSAPFCDALDIVGYNYLWVRYGHDKTRFPNRVLIGTETLASCTYESWQATLMNANVAGDFIWTAWDYLGEAGIGRVLRHQDENKRFGAAFPWHQAWCGDFDICGFRRPQSYYREIMWGRKDTVSLFSLHPKYFGQDYGGYGWEWLDVEPTWNYAPEWVGKPVTVEAYTDGDTVEFSLNGQPVTTVKVDKFKARAEIKYEPGKLKARAYRDGKKIASVSLETSGPPASLHCTADRGSLWPDGMDLAYVTIELHDKEGRLVQNQDCLVCCSVSGEGTLAAVGSGNPMSSEPYGVPYRMSYQGKLLAIVRAGLEPGKAVLTVSAQGLPSVSLPVNIV